MQSTCYIQFLEKNPYTEIKRQQSETVECFPKRCFFDQPNYTENFQFIKALICFIAN